MSGVFMDTLLNGQIDFIRDKMMVSLFDAQMRPDYTLPNAYGCWPFVSAREVGVPKGGVELVGKNLYISAGTLHFDAADSAWPRQTFSTASALIYDATQGNQALAHIDFGSSFSVTRGTFTINWNATGIFTLDFGVGEADRFCYPKAWEIG